MAAINGSPQRDALPLQILATFRALGSTRITIDILWLSLWSVISAFAQAALLVLLAQIAVGKVQSTDTFAVHGIHLSPHNALWVSGGLLLLFLLSGLITASATSRITSRAVQAGRHRLLQAFFRASWDVQAKEELGHVQQLLTFNCGSIGDVLGTLASGLQALLTATIFLASALVIEPLGASAVLGFGIVLFLLLRPINLLGRRAGAELSTRSNALATNVTEFTRLTREFRLFGIQDRAIDRLEARNVATTKSYRRSRLLTLIAPVIYQVFALGFILVGVAVFIEHGNTNIAATGAVLLLLLRALASGSALQAISVQVRTFEAFLDDARLELTHYQTNAEPGRPTARPRSFDIVTKDVAFSYDGRHAALSGVSLEVADGEALGILGRSGSGKSTLSQLLLGLRRPSSGEILLGGVPVWEVARDPHASPIAFVAQEPVLLRGSIAENISFLREFPREQIEQAARLAHLHEEVLAMPERYDTPVGEGGGALSGGQRQRLALARALIAHPRLLVLDEPTSALDSRSEQLIRTTLNELKGHMTIIVISHRLATISDCDRLLLLDRGKVVALGNPATVRDSLAFQDLLAVPREHLEGNLSTAPHGE